LLAIVMLLGACTAGVPASPAQTIGPKVQPSSAEVGATSTSAPSSPELAESRAPAGTSAPKHQEPIAVGSDERVVDLFVPSIPEGERVALIVLLHANGEAPYVMAQATRAGALAARERLVVALPPARGHRWDALGCCTTPIPESPDVAYVRGLIKQLVADLPIDPSRVFVGGFSMGAVLSERLACEASDLVAAVAIDAGRPWSDTCTPTSPVSVLIMHGTGDGTFPFSNAGELAARWRGLEGCSGAPDETDLSPIAHASTNDSCAAGAAVEFVRYEGAGHRWFANPDATEVAWNFFAAHPKPE